MRAAAPAKRLVIALLAAWLSGPLLAAEHVWFIGGGADLESSQAQIEANVAWAMQQLRALPGPRTLHVHFSDGDDPAPDVKVHPAPPGSYLEPLARLLAVDDIGGYLYRNHRLGPVQGGTARDRLLPALRREFADLGPGDRALIVFNGHGVPGRFDAAGNQLMLWGGSVLDVREFEALLGQFDPRVPVRFVLTQCYAGGFARAVHAAAARTLELAPGERCGFLAEAADQPAEGCSAAINIADFRDYTTYFFAALAGRARDGTVLAVNPDRNRDGRVSLREAHLYVQRVAHSADLPRSTSEDFLERWRPWYPEWRRLFAMDAPAERNLYTALAEELATDIGLPAEERARRRAIRVERRRLWAVGWHLDREQRRLYRLIVDQQHTLREALGRQWPALAELTAGHARARTPDNVRASDWLTAQAGYAELVAAQDGYARSVTARIERDRNLARLDRVERLAWLARLLGRFEREAGPRERRAFQRLVDCEDRGL